MAGLGLDAKMLSTELQVTLDKAHPWEVDGEIMGSTRRLTIVAQPGALLLRLPPESA
jgi:diacylglycerol kinase family enzyme